jgi:hypothetical protein
MWQLIDILAADAFSLVFAPPFPLLLDVHLAAVSSVKTFDLKLRGDLEKGCAY